MTTDGYTEYEFVADLYDHVVPYRERQDVAFFVNAARETGGPVLEIGCGTGRVLIPTARAGVSVTGLDRSAHMLAVCRHALAKERPMVQSLVQLIEGDMREFEIGRRFSLVIIPFRPFQHLLAVEDQLACLRSIHRHLAPGGRFILDVFNLSYESMVRDNLGQELSDEPPFTMPDGRRVVRRHKTVARDRINQVNQVELIYDITHPDGREERFVHAFAMRYFFRFELEHLLARTGFAVETIYADYDRSPLGAKTPGELIVVARRADEP